MSSEENKEIAHRILRDVLEQRNLDAVEELYAADAVEHSPMRDFRGHEEIKASFAETLDAFSDYTVSVEEMIVEGDTVAARLTERGVHDGELMGIEPTGNEFEHQTMAFLRLEDGKVAEWWVLPDNLSFLQQLGVVESPGE